MEGRGLSGFDSRVESEGSGIRDQGSGKRKEITIMNGQHSDSARVRGLGAREELIERAGGVLRLAEAARRLGVSSQAITARRGRGTLLAVPMPNGEWVYPARQFGEAGVIAGLGEVVREFRDVSPWTQLAVLLAPSARFGGSSAFDLLEAGDIEGARSIAATYGEQG
jgi:hypothetical protein